MCFAVRLFASVEAVEVKECLVAGISAQLEGKLRKAPAVHCMLHRSWHCHKGGQIGICTSSRHRALHCSTLVQQHTQQFTC